jgi:lactadherin
VYQPNGYSWCAKYKSPSEWLQVDLGVAAKITGVMTQGRSNGAEWVTSFMVSYSLDAFYWQYVKDLYGNQRVFEGNSDSYSVKHSYLDEPILARFVKFHTIHWNSHPSMRIEIIGCQVCKQPLALPPYGKITASSEKTQQRSRRTPSALQGTAMTSPAGGLLASAGSTGSVSCQADDAYILTKKAWCSREDSANQWLQIDIGPPTLVTGVVTKGRGDGGRKHWVTRFRLSYTNDTAGVWFFYKDANHLDAKDFGGNVDKDIERVHYLNSPFIARYVRFHPMDWHKHISMRAGLIGCPYKGACTDGFMRVNEFTPCVANVAFQKESFVSSKRVQHKRHSAARRGQWMHGHAARAVDGDVDQALPSCTVLDNFYVDKPVWMVDLGGRMKISGVLIVTWQGSEDAESRSAKYPEYTQNLDKLAVYVDSKGDYEAVNDPDKTCGFVTRLNDALFQPRLHVQCAKVMYGRYVYVEAWGVPNRWTRLFSAVLCEVMVYE